MTVYGQDEHIENNCCLCEHFTSYSDDYYDPEEPEDQGFCCLGRNKGYGDACTTCPDFKAHALKKVLHMP